MKKISTHLEYLARGGFWLVGAQSLIVVISLIGTTVLANYLTPTDFGIYKYLVEIGLLLSFLSLTGLANAIAQAAARGYNLLHQTRKIFLLSSAPIVFISLGLSLYYFINDNQILAVGCLAIAVLQPFVQTFNNNQALLNGTKKFRQSSLQRVLQSLFVTFIISTTALISQDGLTVFLSFLLAQSLFSALNNHNSRKYEVESEIEIEPSRKKRFISFAKHTSVRNFISGTSQKVDSLFLFQHLGSFELATYAISLLIPEQLRGATKNLQTLLIPKLANSDRASLRDLGFFRRMVMLIIFLCIVAYFVGILVPVIFDLIFPKYTHAIQHVQILLITVPAAASVVPMSILQSLQANKELYILHTSIAVFQTVGAVLSILAFGLLGAVIFRVVIQYLRLLAASTLLVYFKYRTRSQH